MEAIHVFNHRASFMEFKLIEEAAYAFDGGVCRLPDLIETIPFVIIIHPDKMFWMVVVQVGSGGGWV